MDNCRICGDTLTKDKESKNYPNCHNWCVNLYTKEELKSLIEVDNK